MAGKVATAKQLIHELTRKRTSSRVVQMTKALGTDIKWWSVAGAQAVALLRLVSPEPRATIRRLCRMALVEPGTTSLVADTIIEKGVKCPDLCVSLVSNVDLNASSLAISDYEKVMKALAEQGSAGFGLRSEFLAHRVAGVLRLEVAEGRAVAPATLSRIAEEAASVVTVDGSLGQLCLLLASLPVTQDTARSFHPGDIACYAKLSLVIQDSGMVCRAVRHLVLDKLRLTLGELEAQCSSHAFQKRLASQLGAKVIRSGVVAPGLVNLARSGDCGPSGITALINSPSTPQVQLSSLALKLVELFSMAEHFRAVERELACTAPPEMGPPSQPAFVSIDGCLRWPKALRERGMEPGRSEVAEAIRAMTTRCQYGTAVHFAVAAHKAGLLSLASLRAKDVEALAVCLSSSPASARKRCKSYIEYVEFLGDEKWLREAGNPVALVGSVLWCMGEEGAKAGSEGIEAMDAVKVGPEGALPLNAARTLAVIHAVRLSEALSTVSRTLLQPALRFVPDRVDALGWAMLLAEVSPGSPESIAAATAAQPGIAPAQVRPGARHAFSSLLRWFPFAGTQQELAIVCAGLCAWFEREPNPALVAKHCIDVIICLREGVRRGCSRPSPKVQARMAGVLTGASVNDKRPCFTFDAMAAICDVLAPEGTEPASSSAMDIKGPEATTFADRMAKRVARPLLSDPLSVALRRQSVAKSPTPAHCAIILRTINALSLHNSITVSLGNRILSNATSPRVAQVSQGKQKGRNR